MKNILLKLQPFYRRNPRTNRRTLLLIAGVIFTLLIIGPAYSSGESPSSNAWIINPAVGPTLPFNPQNSQCFILNNNFAAASLTATGEIIIWTLADGNWIESTVLSHSGISFATFQIQDLNNDQSPEIIAGTSDPGYIDVFEYAAGRWELRSSEKYLWSSVVNLVIGKLDDTGTNYILAQSREGYLFLYAKVGDTVDLIWKSPTVWRFFESAIMRDIDGDHRDELVVSYQNGGMAVLKMVNKAMVSVWENYVWGKAVVLTAGDWDNDGLPEIIIGTTQKVIYFLGYGGTGFQFESQVSQFNFTPEQLAFRTFPDRRELLVADTSGKFHLLQSDLKTKKWQETASTVTGRIARIVVNPLHQDIFLWTYNQTSVNIDFINPKDLKLKFQDQEYVQNPAPLFLNNQWYISPRALTAVSPLGLNCQSTKTSYKVSSGSTIIEVLWKTPNLIMLNGKTLGKANQAYIVKNEIYFTPEFYLQVFNITINVNLSQHDLEIQKVVP